MVVRRFAEERCKDNDLALVVPQRLELICRSGDGSPWGFSFAGFETSSRGAIEFDVTGSGDFEPHDIFSLAGISLDFGTPSGWAKRSLFGVGLIGPARPTHPPGWGVGTTGHVSCQGNLVKANADVQHVSIDPAKYAPADWDGRLWIGLMLHNTGMKKWIAARITNGGAGDSPALPALAEAEEWQLLKAHQKQFLERAVQVIEKEPPRQPPMQGLAEEMKPYADADPGSDQPPIDALKRALSAYDTSPSGAQGFLTLAEDYFAWENRVARPRPADRFNGFLAKWREGGEFGKEIGCIVRTATNIQKVGLSEIDSGTIVARDNVPIEISAARHEHEGFQVILTPLPGCSEHVSVKASDLTGPAGTIAATNVTINPVGYIRIFPGQAKEKLVPDPLLLGDIPALKPGENQPVWFDVYVPPTTTQGEYRGSVSINGGKSPLSIPVLLRVRSFEIPKKISLRSSFWLFRDQLNRFYHVDEIALDDYFKWVDMALAHRVNPIDVYEGYCKPLVDISVPEQKFDMKHTIEVGTVNPKPDFSKWDRYIDRMVAGGANTLNLGTSHHFGSFFCDKPENSGTPEQVERLKQAVGIMAEHYKQRGVWDMHYLQLRDETSEPKSLNVYRGVHAAYPEVKTLLTVPSQEAKPFVEIPCPQTPGFDPVWRDQIHKVGGEYWWYVCVSPPDPYANLFLFQSGSQHRALFWQTWSHHVDGLLYWGMNFWAWYEFKWPADAKGPSERVPAKDAPNFVSVPEGPGDGCSMYPGPTISQPLSSIRLESMRDGEEDYEYFVLLDSLIARAEKANVTGDALNEAKASREEASQLVANMTEYERKGEPYLRIRNRVGDAIEALMKLAQAK